MLLRLPWRTWVCPCEARCGAGATAWVAGVLVAPGTQASWRLGQQEIQCSRRVWEPVLANTLQYSCLENPGSLTEKPGRPQFTGSKRVGHYGREPVHIDTRLFSCGSSVPGRGECEGGAAACLVVAPSVRGHGLPPPQELRSYQVFSKPLVAGDQKASSASLSP